MRALVTDPSDIPPERYRRFIRRAQLGGLLADQLVQGEPYPALNAVVLEAGDAARLARLTEIFSTAFDRAARRLAADVPALVELGFPWLAAELLAAEAPRRPLVGRFDFVRDAAGHWWLLEFNADTPSGIREAIVVDRLVHAMLPADSLGRPNAGLAPALVAAFRAAVFGPERDGAPPGRVLGLVTTAGELEDLAQMAFTEALLRAPFASLGGEVVLGDADNLRPTGRGLTLCGRRIDALYRYVPFEAMLGTPPFVAIYAAVLAGRLRLLNGLYGLLLQHKGLLAWLWQHRHDRTFPSDERAAIRAHLAPTWPIDAAPDGLSRATLVAKQVFGREGEEVFFGEDLAPVVWKALRRRRTYVAQQRLQLAPLAAVVPTSGGPRLELGHVTIGGYAVDGRWAGYYTRFGGKIITSRAKWLATFVERGETSA